MRSILLFGLLFGSVAAGAQPYKLYGLTANGGTSGFGVLYTILSDGSGYRLIASDGGVFSYNAPFYGSAGSLKLNKPVVAGVNNNSYDGYWLFASDGGVFTYSPTNEGMPFYGSAA